MIQYIAVAFLEDFEVGHEFVDWPLHVTLITWFDVGDIDTAIRTIANRVSDLGAIRTMVGEEKTWGPNTVNVIEKTPGLAALHERLFSFVKDNGRLLTNEQYMGENYTPHVTHQKGERATDGTLIIDKVYIIIKDANQRTKTILSRIDLQ